MIDGNLLIKDLKLKRAKVVQDELRACCPNPLHNEDHPSFSINLFTGKFNCFACGFKGTSVIQLYLFLDVPTPDWAVDETRTATGYKRKGLVEKEMANTAKQNLLVRNSFLDFLSANQDEAYEKLKHRGVSSATVKNFSVGYNIQKDILFFPALDITGKLIGWAERCDAWPTRWRIMPEGVEKGKMLFGEHLLQEGVKNNLYVVEGMLDCMKMVEWGFKCVALYGSDVLPEQAIKITNLAHHVILIPDNDKGGLKLRYSAMKKLKGKVLLSGVNLPEGINDIGSPECTMNIVKKAIKERVKII